MLERQRRFDARTEFDHRIIREGIIHNEAWLAEAERLEQELNVASQVFVAARDEYLRYNSEHPWRTLPGPARTGHHVTARGHDVQPAAYH